MSATTIETTTLVAAAEEFDSQMRNCVIFRYLRPVEHPWLKNPSSAQMQHWALVAHFPQGNRSLLFEAAENQETQQMEAFVSQSLWTEYKNVVKEEIVKVVTSPKQLLKLAQRHPKNGSEYSVTFNNCQEWFKIYLNLILRDCQHNSPDGLLSTASAKLLSTAVVTYLDEAVKKSGVIPGKIAAGFWHMAGRLAGRFSNGPARPLSSSSRALPSSSGTRSQPDWTIPSDN